MSTTISGDTGVDKFEGTTIAGHVIQVANYTTGTGATGTALIPFDNTIPQITEGTQFMSLAFTPKKANSKLKITVLTHSSCSVTTGSGASLFIDGVNDAIASSMLYYTVATTVILHEIISFYQVSNINTRTFSVRLGLKEAGTLTFNGYSGTAYFGGSLASSITIEEIAQ